MTQTAAGVDKRILTATQLADRTLLRRAIESVIWGMPAVNLDLLYQGMVQCKGAYNQIVCIERTK